LKKNISFPIIPIYITVLPTLSDYWLTGFCDAEACFTSSFNEIKGTFSIRFIITQKWLVNKIVLDYILNLFFLYSNKKIKGYINLHSVVGIWELSIHGIYNCKYLLYYFDKFALKTKKLNSYNYWKLLLSKYTLKDHLDLIKKKEIVSLIKLLNKS
jgi:hypothetical protein